MENNNKLQLWDIRVLGHIVMLFVIWVLLSSNLCFLQHAYFTFVLNVLKKLLSALVNPKVFKHQVQELEAIVLSELLPIRCILRRTITIIRYTQTHLCTKVQICPVIYVFGGDLMPKTKCSNCGEAIEYSNSFCSKCGTEMPKNQIIELNKEVI